jgi:NAD(P)-dependent dehydrogenase (short-subunit alcohol dehydrogenase family)
VQALEGKHAVVTGGGRGIGAAIAAALAERGATLTLMGRDHTRLKAQAQVLAARNPVHTVAVDVANAHSVAAAFTHAEAARGPVHILVNSAGIAASAPFARTDLTLIVRKTGKSEEEARAALVSRNPQQRLVRPEEVANAALWLCLPGAEAITGQAIAVAGGEVL